MVGGVDPGGKEVWCWIKAPRHDCGAYFSECRSEPMRGAPAFDDGRKGNIGIQAYWEPRVWGFFGQLIAEALEGSGFLYVDVTRLAPIPNFLNLPVCCQSNVVGKQGLKAIGLEAVVVVNPELPGQSFIDDLGKSGCQSVSIRGTWLGVLAFNLHVGVVSGARVVENLDI